MARVTNWRSSLWARWLGWTAVFAVGLVAWGAFLETNTWQDNPLRVLVDEHPAWAMILVPSALAFGIGVRFAYWGWLFGVFVTDVLVAAFLIRAVAGEPAASGSGQAVAGIYFVFLFLILPSTLLAAAAGVGWGKRRHAADGE
jgi:hypothetical protein